MPRSASPNLRAGSKVIRFTTAAKRAAARAGDDLIFHVYHFDDKCIDVEVGQRRPMADGCETGG